MAMGSAPLMGTRPPSRPSSPIIMYLPRCSADTMLSAAIIPMAMGRSYAEPSLRMSAGAMFTTICLLGSFSPLNSRADLMRSWLSFTALSGRPTRKKRMPRRAFTSIVTCMASMPCRAAAYTFTNIVGYLRLLLFFFLLSFSLSFSLWSFTRESIVLASPSGEML